MNVNVDGCYVVTSSPSSSSNVAGYKESISTYKDGGWTLRALVCSIVVDLAHNILLMPLTQASQYECLGYTFTGAV